MIINSTVNSDGKSDGYGTFNFDDGTICIGEEIMAL